MNISAFALYVQDSFILVGDESGIIYQYSHDGIFLKKNLIDSVYNFFFILFTYKFFFKERNKMYFF